MEVKTEPAGRLIDILSEAKKKPANIKVRKVWADVFDIEENDTGTILRMLADLIQLTFKTKSQIKNVDNIDHDLYLKPFIKIEVMLSQINLDAPWQSWQQQIDEPTIYGLQFCSDRLNREANFTSLKSSEIDQIKKTLEELTDRVSNSKLETPLKLLLVRNLESLRQALIAYKIKGIDGIETELELNLGSLILNKDKIKDSADIQEPKSFIQKYFNFLDGINKTVSTAKKVDQLTGNGLSKLIGVEC